MAIAEIIKGDYATLDGRTVQFRTGEEVLVKFLGGENIERLWPYDDITDPTPGAITTTVADGLAVEVLGNRAVAYDVDDNTEQDEDIGATRANGTVTTKPTPTPTFAENVLLENKYLEAADLGGAVNCTIVDDPHRFVQLQQTAGGNYSAEFTGATGAQNDVVDMEVQVATFETTSFQLGFATTVSSAIEVPNTKGGFRTISVKGLILAELTPGDLVITVLDPAVAANVKSVKLVKTN